VTFCVNNTNLLFTISKVWRIIGHILAVNGGWGASP